MAKVPLGACAHCPRGNQQFRGNLGVEGAISNLEVQRVMSNLEDHGVMSNLEFHWVISNVEVQGVMSKTRLQAAGRGATVRTSNGQSVMQSTTNLQVGDSIPGRLTDLPAVLYPI